MIQDPVFGDLEFISKIGRGTYADVYKVYSKSYDAYFAAKIDRHSNQDTEEEYLIHEKVNHPMICQYYSSQVIKGKRVGILEFVEGDNLLHKVNRYGILNETDARVILLQMVSVLMHLHDDLHLIHRDIKCENILIDSSGNVKLIDFGFAAYYDEKDERESIKTFCGSPEYMAPESIQKEIQTPAIDVWSLGVVLYAVTIGTLPFDQMSQEELFQQILTEEPEYNMHISIELRDLLRRMLNKDYHSRITLKEILNHPWVNMMVNGSLVKPNLAVFDTLMILPNDDSEIDSKALTAMATKCDLHSAVEHIKKHDNSPDTVMYKYFRRRSLFTQLVTLRSYIFEDAPIPLSSGSKSIKNCQCGQSCIFTPSPLILPQRSSDLKTPLKKMTCIAANPYIHKNMIRSPVANALQTFQNFKLSSTQAKRKKVRHNSNYF